MIYILLVENLQEVLKNAFQATTVHSGLKKIEGLLKDFRRNVRTFQGLPLKFNEFLRLCEPSKLSPLSPRFQVVGYSC